MPDLDDTIAAIAEAPTWDARVTLIRQIPERFGMGQQAEVYSQVARAVYVSNLAPDFAYVHWRDDYELGPIEEAYGFAYDATAGFTDVSRENLATALTAHPTTLRVFRLLLGFTTQEFAASTAVIAEEPELPVLSNSKVKAIEAAGAVTDPIASTCATVIDRAMSGDLFPEPAAGLRRKTEKPDTVGGWYMVQRYAAEGVPLPAFLHQRHYGGAFRQLLDATSSQRGNILEDGVAELFDRDGIRYVRTASHDQAEIERRFGLTVRPAPDFVVYNGNDAPRALLECKGANDGGTARDKAARFRGLRQEAMRLGGVPLFAVLSGLGWRRTADALGPVVQHTDGRTFTLANLGEMLTVQPFPALVS
jgi:hypothetical protein